jgi:radical SAM superfamily enzyme YgiQ (UPF0313 family)
MPKALLINAIDKSLLLAEQPPFPFPVLGVITVAALFPSDWEIEVIDEAVEDINPDAEADLVGISTLTLNAFHAYMIADHFRGRRIPVLMGGMHPTAMPEEALRHADAVVVGEAEGIFGRVLLDFKDRRMRGVYWGEKLPDLDKLPRPRYDLLRRKHRKILHSVQATRGCPHSCEFCSVTPFFGHSYRFRPVEEVLADLQASFDRSNSNRVFFVDDNIVGTADYAKELFRALVPLRIKWGSFASVAMTQNREIMKLAEKSGCTEVLVGFESLSQTNLDASHKPWVRVDRMREYIRIFHDHGMIVQGSFIFGHDDDRKDVFCRTIDFIQETGIQVPVFAILTPYPASRLRARLEREGRLLPEGRDWRLYDVSHALFRPVHMTPEELEEGFLWSRKYCAAPRTIFGRMFRAPRANWLTALGLNFSMRSGRMRQIKARWPRSKGRLTRPATW